MEVAENKSVDTLLNQQRKKRVEDQMKKMKGIIKAYLKIRRSETIRVQRVRFVRCSNRSRHWIEAAKLR